MGCTFSSLHLTTLYAAFVSMNGNEKLHNRWAGMNRNESPDFAILWLEAWTSDPFDYLFSLPTERNLSARFRRLWICEKGAFKASTLAYDDAMINRDFCLLSRITRSTAIGIWCEQEAENRTLKINLEMFSKASCAIIKLRIEALEGCDTLLWFVELNSFRDADVNEDEAARGHLRNCLHLLEQATHCESTLFRSEPLEVAIASDKHSNGERGQVNYASFEKWNLISARQTNSRRNPSSCRTRGKVQWKFNFERIWTH